MSKRGRLWGREETMFLIGQWMESAIELDEGGKRKKSFLKTYTDIQTKFNQFYLSKEKQRSIKEISTKLGNLKQRWKEETAMRNAGTHTPWAFYDSMTDAIKSMPDYDSDEIDRSVEKIYSTMACKKPRKGTISFTETALELDDSDIASEIPIPPVTNRTKRRARFDEIPVCEVTPSPKKRNTNKRQMLESQISPVLTDTDNFDAFDTDNFDDFGARIASDLRNITDTDVALSVKDKIGALFCRENLYTKNQSIRQSSPHPAPKAVTSFSSEFEDELLASTANRQDYGNRHIKLEKESFMGFEDDDDECDTFCKSISSQLKKIPLKDRILLYGDIQQAVALKRAQLL